MATSGADWTLVGVTGAAAMATAVAASFTALMARRTRNLAGETKQMATATREMAEATKKDADASAAMVQETQKDREMTYRPVLTVAPLRVDKPLDGAHLRVTNIGTGAALGCLVILKVSSAPGSNWLVSSTPRDVAAGDSSLPMPLRQEQSNVAEYFGQTDDFGAIFCRDMLDRRHRFPVRTNRENEIVVYPDTQSFRTWDDAAPPWVTTPVLWEAAAP